MLRRIASLLLIPVLLANQAAMCCAHTHHSGSDVEDHSQRVHVHLGGHHHDQCHDHDHSDHQYPVDDNTSDDADSVQNFETGCHVDHDGDAIYLNDKGEFRYQSTRLMLERISPGPVIELAEQWTSVTISERPNRVTRAGSFLPYHCPVYLQTCCLLI